MAGCSIAVVIPARNAASHLAACLERVRSQRPRPLEVIVVDDGSTDDTARVAERFGARVVRLGRHRGISAARNAGVSAAKADVVAFMDADDLPEDGWLAAIEAAVSGGAPIVDFEKVTSARRELAVRHIEERWDRRAARDASWPASIPAALSKFAIQRTLYEELGGFDEYLRASEDGDFALRAALAGQLATVATARFVLTPRATAAGLARQRFRWAYWSVFVARKHRCLPFAFPPPMRLGRRAATAAAAAAVHAARRDTTSARLSLMEVVHVGALASGRVAARVVLAVDRRRVPAPFRPVGVDPALVGAGLPVGPAAVLVGERRLVAALARALTADREVAAPPPGLLPHRMDDWDAPPPAAAMKVARRARMRHWDLNTRLAARRLAAAPPATRGDAIMVLHAVQAWLTRSPRWVVAAPGAAGHLAVERLPEARIIGVGRLPPLPRPTDVTIDARTMRTQPASAIEPLAALLGLHSPARVAAVLRYAMLTRFLR